MLDINPHFVNLAMIDPVVSKFTVSPRGVVILKYKPYPKSTRKTTWAFRPKRYQSRRHEELRLNIVARRPWTPEEAAAAADNRILIERAEEFFVLYNSGNPVVREQMETRDRVFTEIVKDIYCFADFLIYLEDNGYELPAGCTYKLAIELAANTHERLINTYPGYDIDMLVFDFYRFCTKAHVPVVGIGNVEIETDIEHGDNYSVRRDIYNNDLTPEEQEELKGYGIEDEEDFCNIPENLLNLERLRHKCVHFLKMVSGASPERLHEMALNPQLRNREVKDNVGAMMIGFQSIVKDHANLDANIVSESWAQRPSTAWMMDYVKRHCCQNMEFRQRKTPTRKERECRALDDLFERIRNGEIVIDPPVADPDFTNVRRQSSTQRTTQADPRIEYQLEQLRLAAYRQNLENQQKNPILKAPSLIDTKNDLSAQKNINLVEKILNDFFGKKV